MNNEFYIPGQVALTTGGNVGIGRVTAIELAKRVQGTSVSTYSLHPGVVDTEIWRALPNWARPLIRLRGFLTPEEGALTTMHCAMHAPQEDSGLYYADSQPMQPAALGQNSDLAGELWRRSEAWVSQA